jgi:hypothetical protein
MENAGELIPICPPPWDSPNDLIPLLVVAGCFLAAGWALRRRRRKRKQRQTGKQ